MLCLLERPQEGTDANPAFGLELAGGGGGELSKRRRRASSRKSQQFQQSGLKRLWNASLGNFRCRPSAHLGSRATRPIGEVQMRALSLFIGSIVVSAVAFTSSALGVGANA